MEEAREKQKDITIRHLELLDYIIRRPLGVNTRELINDLEIPASTSRRMLKRLSDAGWLEGDLTNESFTFEDRHRGKFSGSVPGNLKRWRINPKQLGLMFDTYRVVFEKMLEIRREEEEKRGLYAHTKGRY